MVAAPSHDALLHFTQAILHGIHKIFPRPGPHDNANDKPNSIKKLKNGEGCWATRKEILGLVFDGTTCCINLLADKVTAILQSKRTHQKDHHPNWRLGKINSKLLYATIGIPNGCSLLSPIIATIAAQPKMHHYKDCTIQLNQAAKQALTNWQTLLATTSHAAAHPMHGPYSCPGQLWWLL